MKKTDLTLLAEAYQNVKQDSIISYTAGNVKIALVFEEETADWVINWYEDNVFNQEKSIKTQDKAEAEHLFFKLKNVIVKESVKPRQFDSMIVRNTVEQDATHPFLLSVDKIKYPCKTVHEAKSLAQRMNLRPQVLV